MALNQLKNQAMTAFYAALEAAAPAKVMASSLACLEMPPTVIFSLGKAAGPMAAACRKAQIEAEGILISHDPSLILDEHKIAGFDTIIGGHPVPNDKSMLGARKMLNRAQSLTADDHLLMLVSGGGSALMSMPGQGLDLKHKIIINEYLLASGLDIHAMNAVRRFFSGVKGGRLAKAAFPAKVTQWVLSDVPPTGDELTDLSAIASGAMAADPVPEDQMREYLDHAGLLALPWVSQYLSMMAAHPELHPLRPWNDHDHSYLDRVDTKILASNAMCCDAATKALQKTNMVLSELSGDAAEMGRTLALIAAKTKTPITAVTGGETVVKFDPKVTTGLGGRSQELALSFLAEMQKTKSQKSWVLLAAGTDGRDGPTDAAGALVHSGLNININEAEQALRIHDSYHILDHYDALIKMPPTGTNLADIVILLTLAENDVSVATRV